MTLHEARQQMRTWLEQLATAHAAVDAGYPIDRSELRHIERNFRFFESVVVAMKDERRREPAPAQAPDPVEVPEPVLV